MINYSFLEESDFHCFFEVKMSQKNQPEETVILFPGEQMPFNRKLLPYEIFSFKKEKSKNTEKYYLSCIDNMSRVFLVF